TKGAYSELYTWSPIGTFGLRVDNLSLPILLIISLLVTLIALFSVSYMRQRIGDDPGRYGLYYSLYMLYSLGMIGTVLATNLIEFYLFFEIMLVPSFFLIAEWGYGERDKISLTYFIWTHVGALVLLVGILVTGFLAGTTDMDSVVNNFAANPSIVPSLVRIGVVGAMCFGLFVKIAQFGLHAWLPSAYAEAPTPISALLSAAMTGIGGYAIVRIVMTIYPSGFQALSALFAGWALVTMFYGSAMALVQDDVKKLLAYSSMSQMGYILFGLATFTSIGISGSMFQYISNATAKGILFIAVGEIMLQFRERRYPRSCRDGIYCRILPTRPQEDLLRSLQWRHGKCQRGALDNHCSTHHSEHCYSGPWNLSRTHHQPVHLHWEGYCWSVRRIDSHSVADLDCSSRWCCSHSGFCQDSPKASRLWGRNFHIHSSSLGDAYGLHCL